MIILNTGGTFNKRYNAIKGELEVPQDNEAVEKIVSYFTYDVEIEGIIYKDSLDINNSDRKSLKDKIISLKNSLIIVVHGTDTMEETALYLSKANLGKVIILTGAMTPFSIDPIEATSNLSLALGFAEARRKDGIYIAMQGIVSSFERVKKNRELGRFELE